MEKEIRIVYITFILAFTGGYCDILTFIIADNIFSAHVTGNIIVFAYDIINYSTSSFEKLFTFPVFFISVMLGGWIIGKTSHRYTIILIQGYLLIGTSILALGLEKYGFLKTHQWMIYLLTMLVVCAMGLQGAFSKLFSKETHGFTTMMTGNVIMASLDLLYIFKTKFKDKFLFLNLKEHLVSIGGFLCGCILGGIGAKYIGFHAILLPGILLLILSKNVMRINLTRSEKITKNQLVGV